MKRIIIYYSFIIIGVMTLSSFLKAESTAQIISATIFFPLFIYFSDLILPKRKKAIIIQPIKLPIKKKTKKQDEVILMDKKKDKISGKNGEGEAGEVLEEGKLDIDRRVFLKIIGSAGAGLFLMSIFTKKTHAAFFGSVPGPGTLALKDSAGDVIDPAIKTPTDGYKISEIDDASSPAYYGFIDKTGAWFIMKEESSGAYRYTKGGASFSVSWALRGTLTYGYFDSIF